MTAAVAWWVGESLRDLDSWQLGVTAGLGSGKTHGADQWHFDRVLQNKGCPFSAQLWPTYLLIHNTGFPTYRKVLGALGFKENEDFRFLKTPIPKLVFHGLDHEVHFLSAERPERIVAVEYSHATEHEAGIIAKEASENLRSRVRRPEAKIKQVLREGAPQGLNNFADDFNSSEQPNWNRSIYRDHRRVDMHSGHKVQRRRFQVWTDDSPWISPEYIITLEDTYGHNPNLIKSYRYGEFCALTLGAAYPNYMPQLHDLREDSEPDPYNEIAMCWDFNHSPLAWVALQKVMYPDYEKRVHKWTVYHEANQGNTQLDTSVAEFAAKHPRELFGATPIKLYGDRTGHSKNHRIAGSDFENIERYLKALGYKDVQICAQKAVIPEASSAEALNRLFLLNIMVLCPRVRMFRRSLMQTRWKVGTRQIEKPHGETHTHHAEAVKNWAWQETREDLGKDNERILGIN